MTFDQDGPITAATLRELLNRIGRFLGDAEQQDRANRGVTYHPEHPTVLLAQAEAALEELAIRAGVWPAPRTVSRPGVTEP